MLARPRHSGLAGPLLALVVAGAVAAQDAPAPDLPPVTIEQFLPVQSRTLTVGDFETEHRSTGVAQPFFIIGCDETSLEWLENNRARLREIRAFGLVVEAPDVRSYERLESVAEGLIIRPVVGDLIAEHLGLSRYPALVTADGIFP